jgi:hypothetical protein
MVSRPARIPRFPPTTTLCGAKLKSECTEAHRHCPPMNTFQNLQSYKKVKKSFGLSKKRIGYGGFTAIGFCLNN